MATASVGSLDQFQISYPLAETLIHAGVSSAYESPMYQSRTTANSVFPNGSSAVRGFRIEIGLMTALEARTLDQLFIAAQGGALPVDLTVRGFDQDGAGATETIQVRFVTNPLKFIGVEGGRFSASFDVEELPHTP